MEVMMDYSVGAIVDRLSKENNRLKIENTELKRELLDTEEDLEDMKNCYIRNIQELKSMYESLEEEYDERAKEISKLRSQLREQDKYNDFEKPNESTYELMLKAYSEIGLM